ncbi:MAG: T9SS type A sorting domain-containing protein [Bacteroidota bacterium]|nr:T9SS type A sorting domain-containing protein [Bacteroidota bacterium]
MKKSLLLLVFFLLAFFSKEQVTQINANKSLTSIIALKNTIALFESTLDSSIWISDGTAVGTIQISDTIKYIGYGFLLNGKFIFKGISPHCGKEIFITDGTTNGTKLIKDINPGTANSQPLATTMIALNNHVYFAAVTPGEGCELWKTDGTAGNTTLVKDIVTGATSGIDTTAFAIASNGTVVLFDAKTTANGNELWASAGTGVTTNLLKDINIGATSSNPRAFSPFNSNLLFTITSADALTMQIWRTDGTAGGTVLIKDNIMSPYGFVNNYVFNLFHVFNNHAYFLINDGVHSGDALWSTDGTDATTTHTSFVKDLGAVSGTGSYLLVDAINLADKFIFPYSDATTFFSLWQSDGTAVGTKSFKDFPVNAEGNVPFIFLNGASNPLYNGKFFFSASDANGNELWMSDGTTTQLLKDIYVGANDGISSSPSWLFTTSGLFFAANDGTHGNELWKTDGTITMMVQDIFPNQHNADPTLYFVNNSKIFFLATDNNPADSSVTDLFVVDGTFTPLPVKLVDFTVSSKESDALLQWTTAQELNTKDFTVQSSNDAQHWNNIGSVSAKGNSNQLNQYSFLDIGVMNSRYQTLYYRLVSNDFDGNYSISKIVILKIDNSNQFSVRLLLNPVKNNLKISVTGINKQALLSIHDLNGKEIYKNEIQNPDGIISIPIYIQSGVYILQVKSNNQTKTLKFVKE